MNLDLIKPALSGAVGTTCMTLFSIVTSEKKKKQFREHQILSMLLKSFPVNKRNRLVLSWIAHYITGMTFNVANQNILQHLKTSPSFLNGILLGALNGVVGIAVWKAIFKLHPSPPDINVKKYLAHLILAHLIFGATSNVAMKGISYSSSQTATQY